MIENSLFWYVFGVLFVYSLFDIKKQRRQYKEEKKRGFGYVMQAKIYHSELGIIIVGCVTVFNEVLLQFGI